MTTTPARPAPLFADIADVTGKLTETGYLPDTATATAVFLADRLGKPLLVEGPAGGQQDRTGPRRRAQATGSELVRLQCYEGVDEARALYEWNHANRSCAFSPPPVPTTTGSAPRTTCSARSSCCPVRC